MSWANFGSGGQRCPRCGHDRTNNSRRLTIEFVKSETIKLTNGKYKCLSHEYINNCMKLEFICEHNHKFFMGWNSFSHGRRCNTCAIKRRSDSRKLTIEYVKDKTKKIAKGYECISYKYINNHTKLKFVCPSTHQFSANWHDFESGNRCGKCANKNKGSYRKLTIEFVKSETIKLTDGKYKCISGTYKNSGSKLKFKCDLNHIYESNWENFKFGKRCPICAIENIRKRMAGKNHPNWKNYSDEDRKNIKLYKDEVTQLTNINYIRYFYFINPNKLKREKNKYNLDHIYSVIDGFNNGVPPEVIASPINLQMLWYSDNIIKRGNSYISLTMLYSLHEQFLKETEQC